jgi:sirohydrochlorin ferrochelatase
VKWRNVAASDREIGIIVVDHGSRLAEANEMLVDMARLYGETTGTEIVEPAHMELAEPTIAQAFARCVERGARRVIILPYFLSPGRHSRRDIPRFAREAAAAYPGVTCTVAQPLGRDPRMAEVMRRRVIEAIEGLRED